MATVWGHDEIYLTRARVGYRLSVGRPLPKRRVTPPCPPSARPPSGSESAARFLAMLESGEAVSRAEVARTVGCSRAYVTKVIEPLGGRAVDRQW